MRASSPMLLDAATVARQRARDGPWTSEQMIQLVTGNLVGAGVILIGWYQLSAQVAVADQLVWLNVALVGLGIASVANGIWLLRARHLVGSARVRLLPSPAAAPVVDGDVVATDLVTGESMSRYHRSTCGLAAGKALRTGDRLELEASGLRACEACQP